MLLDRQGDLEIIINVEKCKACGYCIRHCPQKAISFLSTTNSNGYLIPTIKCDKCVFCGNCYTICPDYVYEIKKEG